jgi:putative membrane protein
MSVTRICALALSAVSALAALGLPGLAMAPAIAQHPQHHTMSGDTKPEQPAGMDRGTKFMKEAPQSDMFEIEAAKIALEKSRNEQVRSFAQTMLTDHQRMSMEMMAVAGGTRPAAAQLEPRHGAQLDQLRQETDANFDKRYMEMQVEGHREALTLHQDYSKNGDNAQLKNVATDALPQVQQHLQQAEMLRRQMTEVPGRQPGHED